MKRRLFNLVALVSLLLGLAMAGLWVRSVWWAGDVFTLDLMGNAVAVGSYNGNLGVTRYHKGVIEPQWLKISMRPGKTSWWRPVNMRRSTVGPSMTFTDWFLIVLCSPLPIWWVVHRYHHRPLPGHCLKCGYDLHASKDNCPECGTPIPAKVN